MNTRAIRADFLLILTAIVWGFSFVPQKTSMDSVGPFTYNTLRFAIGALFLLPMVLFRVKNGMLSGSKQMKDLVHGSLIIGSCLFFGISLQQFGLIYTSLGNAGFITGCYVIFVPIVGIFLGRKTGIPTWLGAALTLSGLFVISIVANVHPAPGQSWVGALGKLDFLNLGDVYVFIGSLFWTAHVLSIDHFSKKIDPILLSVGQFGVCCVLCAAACLLKIGNLFGIDTSIVGPELFSVEFGVDNIISGMPSLLYGGLVATGIGYTLQVVAQKDAPPAHAVIIMSLESVFAGIGGILLLGEKLTPPSLAGWALIFAGMIATQSDVIRGKRAP